jgi:secreted Zn-dependent insulinase-like peptidase
MLRPQLQTTSLLTSPLDERHYQTLTLNNGLRVLLVQQHDADMAAAALTVAAGHFDDPADREGLAHFLEHLFFLGSAQYPEPGSLQQMLSHTSGSINAWTGTEHSSFYFDVQPDHFGEALARFADMFSQPLLSDSAILQEREAIDAEFYLKLKDDSRRIYQAHKETVNPAHPFAKFSVGNRETLADRPNQPVRAALTAFFHQHYHAGAMTLVLQGPQSLAELSCLASTYFASIAAERPAKPPLQMPLYLPHLQAAQLTIEPHKPMQRLVLSFAMPDIQPWYRYKLISFLAHLLGDEADGSLLAFLRRQGWANGLSAGGGIDGSNYKDFTLACDLTDAGLTATDEIVSACFSYLSMLKQQPLPQHLFAERQQLVDWSFRFQEPKTVLQHACDLSVNMQHYPVHDYIFGDYRMELPPESLYQQVLAYFTPHNLRLMLIAPNVKTDRQAKWYHTPYRFNPIHAEQLAKWQSSVLLPDFKLPALNRYLQTDLALLPQSAHMPQAELIVDSPTLTLWYQAISDQPSPKGHVFVQLGLLAAQQEPAAQAMLRLWLELWLDSINQAFYPATTAGLHYHAYVNSFGITLHLSGIAANQLALCSDLLTSMRQFSQRLSAMVELPMTAIPAALERFDAIKTQLLRHWQSSDKAKPITQLFNQLSSTMLPHSAQPQAMAVALRNIDLASLAQFSQQLWQPCHIEALLCGNWQPEHSHALHQRLVQWQSPDAGPRLPKTQYPLPFAAEHCIRVAVAQVEHAMVLYYPAPDRTPLSIAYYMLANHWLSPLFFQQLRTEQQMGYLVGTGYVPIDLRPGIALYIQSPRFDAVALQQATGHFIAQLCQRIDSIDDHQFQQLTQSLAHQLSERDSNLAARAKRLWSAILQQDPACQLIPTVLSALAELSGEDFRQFLRQRFQTETMPSFASAPPLWLLSENTTSAAD